MANPQVTIDVNADTSHAQQQLKGFASNTAQALSGIKDGLELAKQGFGYLQQAYQATIGETVKYADTVRQLSRVSGANAEQTSRMIQLTDDLGLETSQLEIAMRGAAQKGIALTTQSLAKMSDQYLKLAPGVERNTYLLDNFGRSGLEMAAVLEVGSKKLIAMSGAVEDGLILNKAAVDQARKYEIALDNLNDAILALKISLGEKLLPDIISLIELLNSPGAITAANVINTIFGGTILESQKHKELNSIAQGVENITLNYQALGEAYQRVESPAKNVQQYQWESYNALTQLNPQMNLWTGYLKQAADNAAIADAALKPLTAEILLANSGLEKGSPQWWGLADALGLVDEKSLAAAQKMDALKQQLQGGQITLDTYAAGVWSIAQGIDSIHDKTVTVTVKTIGGVPVQQGNEPETVRKTAEVVVHEEQKTIGGIPIPQAAGMDAVVTQPTRFLAGEAGAERVIVQPITNNNYNLTANYPFQSHRSLMDDVRAMRTIRR